MSSESQPDSYASNPGKLRIDYLLWAQSFSSESLSLLSLLVLLSILTILVNFLFVTGIFQQINKGNLLFGLIQGLFGVSIFNALLIYGINHVLNQLGNILREVENKFLYGCINPGVVVSTKPPLVAVFTDLTKDNSKPCHVIKILSQPLNRIKKGVPAVGGRLATVAQYEGIIENSYWDDFHPQVVNCVTSNKSDIERVMGTIPDWEWEQLDIGLSYLGKTQPGLYHLPFVNCKFCHETVFLPLYDSHLSKHTQPLEDGQMTDHITVCPQQRYQKSLDRIPNVYIHPYCNTRTGMPEDIIRSYLVNPFLYNQYTFCTGCRDYIHQSELFWCETEQCLADYFQDLQQEYFRKIERESN
jgi:Protein of unknown function (DUF3239)